MTEAATAFTPLASTLGGVMIGLSAVALMALLGRVAGISGIVGQLLPPVSADWGWRLAFVAGLLAAPAVATGLSGRAIVQTVPDDPALMAAAGLLVGFGTVLGSGCTSGHGVCGLARLSPRSLAATAIFMGAAFATVLVTRHVL